MSRGSWRVVRLVTRPIQGCDSTPRRRFVNAPREVAQKLLPRRALLARASQLLEALRAPIRGLGRERAAAPREVSREVALGFLRLSHRQQKLPQRDVREARFLCGREARL